MAAIELVEQRTERISLLAGGEHDLVQFVSALLCLGAEGQLLEHVRLLSAPNGRRGYERVLLAEMAGNRQRRCKAGAGRICERFLRHALVRGRVGGCRDFSFRSLPFQNCG